MCVVLSVMVCDRRVCWRDSVFFFGLLILKQKLVDECLIITGILIAAPAYVRQLCFGSSGGGPC